MQPCLESPWSAVQLLRYILPVCVMHLLFHQEGGFVIRVCGQA
jgi:hypothetical protein